eukprot:GHVP01042815.1.p3 GENE.GHVP01042815.1~~GHVP01042815.1.p3  ORF type:complete len:128 (-),score=36.92 GHVP01042815.1:90-473(-)
MQPIHLAIASILLLVKGSVDPGYGNTPPAPPTQPDGGEIDPGYGNPPPALPTNPAEIDPGFDKKPPTQPSDVDPGYEKTPPTERTSSKKSKEPSNKSPANPDTSQGSMAKVLSGIFFTIIMVGASVF